MPFSIDLLVVPLRTLYFLARIRLGCAGRPIPKSTLSWQLSDIDVFLTYLRGLEPVATNACRPFLTTQANSELTHRAESTPQAPHDIAQKEPFGEKVKMQSYLDHSSTE